MSAVFISYRRVGALIHARALFERLSREFGPSQVFIDLDGIDIGLDFVSLIEEQLNGCRIVLALIDPEWATSRDKAGRRRIDREDDFVRIEIATALRRGIHVAPILVDGAEIPQASELPDDLKPLTRRQALELDFRRFDTEVGRLVTVIRRILDATPSPAPPGPRAPAPGVAPTPREEPVVARVVDALPRMPPRATADTDSRATASLPPVSERVGGGAPNWRRILGITALVAGLGALMVLAYLSSRGSVDSPSSPDNAASLPAGSPATDLEERQPAPVVTSPVPSPQAPAPPPASPLPERHAVRRSQRFQVSKCPARAGGREAGAVAAAAPRRCRAIKAFQRE